MAKKKNVNLDQIIKDINNKVKDDTAIMRLGDSKKKLKDIETISTGSLSLDVATGIGGVPKGRIVEIYGPESSGKTTLTLHIIAEAQKSGGNAAFIDVEHALDPLYAEKIGVDTNNLLISAALVPRAEIEGTMGDSHMGLQARLMSQAMRKLTGIVNKSKTCVIFINQIRHKIGIMFGNPETTTGGNALKFYSSLRLEIRRRSQLKDGDSIVGNRTIVKVAKNKLAPPFQKVEFDILYGQGISYEGDLIDKAIESGAIIQSGSWFSYKEDKIAQGKENLRQKLKEDDKLKKSIQSDVKGYLGL